MFGKPAFIHWSIRRRIVIFFFIIVLIIFLPVILFGRLWFVMVSEQTENRVLTHGYRTAVFYLDSRKNFLVFQSTRYAEDPVLADLFLTSGGKNAAYQFLKSMKKSLDLDLVVVLDAKGEIVTPRELGGGGFLGSRISSGAMFRETIASRSISVGFWHGEDDRLWLLATHSITSGADVHRKLGTLVIGFLMDERFSAELAGVADIQVDIFHSRAFLSMVDADKIFLPLSVRNSWKELIAGQKPFLIKREILGGQRRGYYLDTLLRDVKGDVFGIMRIRDSGSYVLRPAEYVFVFGWFFLVFLILSLWGLIKFFTKNVVAPLLRLRLAIQEIASSRDLSKRLKIEMEDEIGGLITEFNRMIEELEVSQKKGKRSSEEMAVLYRDLLDQKKFTSEILATAPSLILVLLPDGRVKFVNETVENILGYKSEEVVGRNWFDYFIPFAQRSEIRGVFEELLKHGTEPHQQNENIVLAKDGMEKLILWHNSILRDRDNKVMAVISIGQDRTDEKRTEQELAQRMKDLERFFRVTVDREHIVIALKNEIKGLREKLKGNINP